MFSREGFDSLRKGILKQRIRDAAIEDTPVSGGRLSPEEREDAMRVAAQIQEEADRILGQDEGERYVKYPFL